MTTATADFDDIQVGKKTSTLATTTNAANVNTDDLSFDWGDQDAMSRGDGLERISPADAKSKVRVAMLTQVVPIKGAHVHFIAKDGRISTYRCLSRRDKKTKQFIGEPADCCKRLNHDDQQKAQMLFAILALKYKNADPVTGGYKAPTDNSPLVIDWEIGWVKLSPAGYKAVSELAFEGEKVHELDFTIGKKANGIGFDYVRKSRGTPLFQADPELMAAVYEAAKQFADGELLAKRLGKVITLMDMKALLAGAAINQPSSRIDNTDDL